MDELQHRQVYGNFEELEAELARWRQILVNLNGRRPEIRKSIEQKVQGLEATLAAAESRYQRMLAADRMREELRELVGESVEEQAERLVRENPNGWHLSDEYLGDPEIRDYLDAIREGRRRSRGPWPLL